MYRQEFEQRLKKGPPPRAVMLFGECEFFFDHYTQLLIEAIGGEPSVLKLYHSEFSLEAARSHLQEPGLFNDGNLLIVKSDKKIDAKGLNALAESVDKNPSSWLILHYEADDGKTKSAQFDPKKHPHRAFVRFFAPKPPEAALFLKEVAAKRGLDITDAGAHHLLRLNDYNLSLSVGELEKLAIVGSAEAKTMDQVVAGHAEGDLFGLTRLLLEKRPFMRQLDQLFLEGMDETRVVSELQKIITQLFLFFCSARVSGQPDSREVLGYKLPRDIEQERAALAIRLNRRQYTDILNLLADMDLLLKSSEGIYGDKSSRLHSALIKIQTKIL